MSTLACITALPQPTVAGTRIRVATTLACDRQGMTVEKIVQQLVPLKPADVHVALEAKLASRNRPNESVHYFTQ
jgi:uncharacterized protein (DUF433 family)